MEKMKNRAVNLLRWSEKYTKTDMVYLAKGGFWLNTNALASNVFAFVLSLVFARFVSKEVYGTYQFLISLGSIIGSVTLVGMNSAVIQAVARGFEGTFRASVKEQLKFALIPFLFGVMGSLYYLFHGNTILSLSVAVIAVFLPISNAFNTWGAYLSGKKDFRNIFFLTQIINLVYYGGLIGIIFILPQAIPLVIGNFLLNTLANIIVYAIIVKHHNPGINIDTEALSYGKKLSLSSLLPMIALNIDNLAVFHFLGSAELAIYAFASNLPERLGSLLRPISSIAFPKFATKEHGELKSTMPRKTMQLLLLSALGGIVYVIMVPVIFKVFFPAYVASIPYSQVYVLAVIASVTSGLPLASLSATRSKHIFSFNIINPLLNIAVIGLATYWFGLWGVVLGRTLGNGILLGLSYYFAQKDLV